MWVAGALVGGLPDARIIANVCAYDYEAVTGTFSEFVKKSTFN